jgi:FMN phosphatase YigB (HAD superfamily)
LLELKTILLDLDETLIHSEEWIRGKKYDIEIEIDVEQGVKDVSILPLGSNLLENWSVHQTLL